MYAEVIVELNSKKIDQMFTYKIPQEVAGVVKVGARVKVSFGRQILEGFVLRILDNISCDYELKPILELVDREPILTREMLWLGEEISKSILCTRIAIYQAMLPKALKASLKTNINIKTEKYVVARFSKEEMLDNINRNKYQKQRELLNKLLLEKELKYDSTSSAMKTLVKKGILGIITKEKYRLNFNDTFEDKRVVLNEGQRNVVNRVIDCLNVSKTYLLYGVTGSGKTEVYMNIIESVIKDGKTAIMLVPEISLTPQIVSRFIARFGAMVAILHSGLSDGERFDEYRKIRGEEVKIVVGARSAIFAPLKNIGVIIMDEEHSSTYKQDNHPRYHARDVALLRSKYHKCPVLLGSATPSLESMARAFNKVYELLVLKERAGKSSLPKVSIVDMKEEIKKNNFVISSVLDAKIRERLSRREQIILFLNRRGYSSVIMCGECGEAIKCSNCDITLTYHKSSDMLRCHYCGLAIKRFHRCPKCNADALKSFGLGTEKLEEELGKRYQTNIVRMDMDTTSKKGSHQKIIQDFYEQKYSILVGTQMIAKGLDFPKVTLVGVINADASLNIPDFRSSERTFQLLSQVAGRAGRADIEGEVVIQTYNNCHYSIMLAARHDYLSFYREEMKIRKLLHYSPYYFIILVTISTKDYELSFMEAKKVGDYLRSNLDGGTYVLGPAMANVFRVNNIYYQQCIIKYQKDSNLFRTLTEIDNHYKMNSKVNVEIDINPNKL